MHLSDFIGLRLQEIGHNDNTELELTFNNGCKIVLKTVAKDDFYIKKISNEEEEKSKRKKIRKKK